MSNRKSHPPSESIALNRRTLLRSAAFVSGALAGMTIEPASAADAKTGDAKAGESPNMNPPVVHVTGGKLRGIRDGKTSTFLGIPYAEAERFEMPKPAKPWDGIKSAQAWGPVCPIPAQQKPGADEFVFPHRYWLESEACQVLNIWTQNPTTSVKKPVMVWMHGGGFTNGSSMESYAYDGKNLSEFGDVVVVSLNHRLNIIGTLDLSAYGSQYENSRYTGMADLVAALQWVQENIAQFGGDPGNVTIFGQSGGGSKVTRLMHMPVAKGLFHKAIAQSGGGLNYRTVEPDTAIKRQQAVAAGTLKQLGLDGSQIDKLKKVPYKDLIIAGTAATREMAPAGAGGRGGGGGGWEVIADDKYVMRELCDWADTIPLMAGTVFSEMQGTLTRGDGRKNEWSQAEIDANLTKAYGDKKAEVVAEFQKAFPRKKVQDVLYFANGSRPGVKQTLAWKLEKSKTPVWNYLFAWEYPVNGGITSFHCSEIAFAFHNVNEPHIRLATGGGPVALALQDRVSGVWLSFAKTGNPGPGFKPWTAAEPNTMVFDTVSESKPLRDDQLITLMGNTGGRGRAA
ncbi:MAG TPA: carboxylesterase family protein [Bryobacteraceae bacterium]|jgi:para-nitrobenzyl esterase|nr:carboxylesterase family protein [Bryobacteraceae bacterium]